MAVKSKVANTPLDPFEVKVTTTSEGNVQHVNVDTITGTLATSSALYAERIDEASASLTYQAWAVLGTTDASALWRIRKIAKSGNVTSITWADGNSNFDNVWNDRAGLTYS